MKEDNIRFYDSCWYHANLICTKSDVTYCVSPCITCEHNPDNKHINIEILKKLK